MSVLLLPFSLFAAVSQDLVYAGTWCHVQGFLFTTLVVTHQLALLTISLDRNYAIMNSLRYPTVFTQSLCISLVVVSWLAGVFVSIPPLLDSDVGEYKFHKNHFLCSLDWTRNKSYLVAFSIFAFGLPILAQSVCYIRIFLAAIGHSKRTAKVTPWTNNSEATRSDSETMGEPIGEQSESVHMSMECKAVRTILIIAAAFVVCWVPFFVECFETMNGRDIEASFSAATICLLYSTGILNPLIYAYMNRITRREIGRFVCGSAVSHDTDDDFGSTSQSTHTSTWGTQHRLPSRSIGTGNDMCTIHEHPEESAFQAESPRRSASKDPPAGPSASPDDANITHSQKFVLCTDSTKTVNSTEIKVEPINVEIQNDELEQGLHESKETKTQTFQASGTSRWNIVKNATLTDSGHGDEGRQYFSKRSRRKKRDCGSFLVFENDSSTSDKRKRRSGRISLDQTHRISLGRSPSFLKLKLSVQEGNLDRINRLSFKSNIEYEHTPRRKRSPKSTNSADRDPDVPPVKASSIFTTEFWPLGSDNTGDVSPRRSARSEGEGAESRTSVKSSEISRIKSFPRTSPSRFQLSARERHQSDPCRPVIEHRPVVEPGASCEGQDHPP